MTQGRGEAELKSRAVNQAEEKSQALTAVNVLGFRITVCPIEGKIVSGEVSFGFGIPKSAFNIMATFILHSLKSAQCFVTSICDQL